MKSSIKLIGILILFVSLTGCTKEETSSDNSSNNTSPYITEAQTPFEIQQETDSVPAKRAVTDMPPQPPAFVDLKIMPKKDPLEPAPGYGFMGLITRLRLRSDTVWGEWVFDTIDKRWVKVQNLPGIIILKWINRKNDSCTLTINNIETTFNNLITSAQLVLEIGEDTAGVLQIDSMNYNANGEPTYVEYLYSIQNSVNAMVEAEAENGHSLWERFLYGRIEQKISKANVEINTYAYRPENGNESITIERVISQDTIITLDIQLTDIIDTVPGYKFREASGDFAIYFPSQSNSIELGKLEGKLWYPEDEAHKTYLRLIVESTGDTIYLMGR